MSQSPIDFINLFVRSPGDLIYFLLVVVVSQAAFFMALGHRLRRPYERATRRYVLAALGVVVTWVFLMIGALFAILTRQDPAAILPPLERAAYAVSILLIGWAFITSDHNRWDKASNLALLALITVVILAYMLTGVQWSGAMEQVDFNQSGFGVAWTVIPIAISLFGIILTLTYFRMIVDAPLKLLFFVVLLIGNGITLYQMMQGAIIGDYSGPARLAFLAALPILPAVLYRLVIGDFQTEIMSSTAIQAISTVEVARVPSPFVASPDEFGNVPDVEAALPTTERESVLLIRALGLMLEGATPSQIPERIVTATLRVLQADIGALLLTQDANYVDVRAAHDRVLQRSLPGMPINLDSQPTLVNAIERRLQRPLFPDRNYDELRDLYTRLDMDQIGPTYFQPLTSGKQLHGILMIGLPYAGKELSESSQELLKGIAVIAVNLLTLTSASESARANAEEQIIKAMVQGAAFEDVGDEVLGAWDEMQAQLEAARAQIAELNRHVLTLKLELDDERSRVATVLEDSDEGGAISERIVALNEEQQRLIDERDRLASRLREAEAALAGATAGDTEGGVKAIIDLLNREREELSQQKTSLEGQLAEMRASRESPTAQLVQEMLARMSQEKARLEVERNQLSAKLIDLEEQLKVLGIEEGMAGVATLLGQLYEQRAQLEARNEVLQRERDALLNERTRLEDKITTEDARDKQLHTLRIELQNIAADREAIMKQRDKLRSERDEFASKQDALKEQRARLTAEVSAFEQELAEAHEEQKQLRVQIQQLADQRSDLIKQRDQLVAERQALSTERDQLLARSDGDRDRLQQLGTEGVGSLTKLVEDISAQRDALDRELNATRTRLAQVEQKLELLQVRAVANADLVQKLDNPEVIVGMVQELRTPMTSIIGYVDLLLGESAGILGEMQRKFLQRVNTNVTRLASMLEDLVRVIVLDSGQIDLIHQPVDVVSVIEDAITEAGSQLREKGLTIHLNLDEDVPPLRADPDAMMQIVGQLLTNAYLASPAGGEIYITARREDVNYGSNGSDRYVQDSLFVSIEDSGGGIAPDDVMRVFSRKYKAENPLIQGLGDTGVGLSIAKALVEAHGGIIWLETEEHVGSAFNFALPLEPVAEPQG